MSKKSTSTQKTTSTAGNLPYFQNLDLLIQEEQALPTIPDWPTIWTSEKTDKIDSIENK